MSKGDQSFPDPDDMFADTRMSFGDHIEDLRRHLIRAVVGFVIGMVIALIFGKELLRFIAAPVEDQLNRFQERYNRKQSQQVADKMGGDKFKNIRPITTKIQIQSDALDAYFIKRFNLPPQEAPVLPHLVPGVVALLEHLQMDHLVDAKWLQDGQWIEVPAKIPDPLAVAARMQELNLIVNPARLSTLRVEESFFVYFKVALMAGLVISSPWVFYQIWAFVAAGLYPQEKRLVNVYLPFSLFLFLLGVFICEFFVIPKAIEALLWFNEWLGFQPELRLNDWLGFAIMMPLIFGLSFQTPLVMLFLEKIGILTVENFRNKRRMAWFVLAIFAALATPSTDAFSMLFLWIPMSLLYELGILLCMWSPRQEEELESAATASEMVEV